MYLRSYSIVMLVFWGVTGVYVFHNDGNTKPLAVPVRDFFLAFGSSSQPYHPKVSCVIVAIGLASRTHTIHVWNISTYIWLIFMVNVGEYTIHGWYGGCFLKLELVKRRRDLSGPPWRAIQFIWATGKKHKPYAFPYFPWNTGCLIGILNYKGLWNNPHVTGQFFIPNKSPKQQNGAPFCIADLGGTRLSGLILSPQTRWDGFQLTNDLLSSMDAQTGRSTFSVISRINEAFPKGKDRLPTTAVLVFGRVYPFIICHVRLLDCN